MRISYSLLIQRLRKSVWISDANVQYLTVKYFLEGAPTNNPQKIKSAFASGFQLNPISLNSPLNKFPSHHIMCMYRAIISCWSVRKERVASQLSALRSFQGHEHYMNVNINSTFVVRKEWPKQYITQLLIGDTCTLPESGHYLCQRAQGRLCDRIKSGRVLSGQVREDL